MTTFQNLFDTAKTFVQRVGPQKNGRKPRAHQPPPPFPGPDQVGATESLVDVLALAGDALVLNNGTFIRMLEVAPVDLERGDAGARQHYWAMFAEALKRLKAPLGIQIVVSTRPQNITPYLQRWDEKAHEWQALAERSDDPIDEARRSRMARGALETSAFLMAAHEQLQAMQQRYLVVITHNPFPEAHTAKAQARVLEDEIVADALEKLDEKVQVVRAALGDIGLPIFNLGVAEMCRALWEHYHHSPSLLGSSASPRLTLRDSTHDLTSGQRANLNLCPAPDEFLRAARDPERLADLLAPSLIEEQTDHIRVGEVIARGYLIHDFDPRTPVDVGLLLSFQADMTHALYLIAADPVTIRQQFKEKETELKASAVTDARRGAVTNWGQQAAINSLESARAEMETALQAPYFLHWHCLIWANDLQTLEKRCQQFETLLKVRDLRFYPATRRHLSLLQSTRPVSRMTYQLKPRNMSADSLGSFFPFSRREYFDPQGWHFGVHRGSGLLVCLEPFEDGRTNASQLILGTPGGGKSVYLKQTIETLLALGHRVFVIDPEREYLRMAVDFHAPYVELGKRSEARRLMIDPTREDAFTAGLLELGELYESLAAQSLNDRQISHLAQVYQATMAHAGIFLDRPETWKRPAPLLSDVLENLPFESDSEACELTRVLSYADALNGGNVMNIMDVSLKSENPWSASAESLAAFVEAILGHRLDSPMFNALVECYQATMHKWGVRADDPSTWEPDRTPTLSALVDTLTADRNPHSHELAEVLRQYAYGLYADLFNHQTTVDVGSAQLVVFGMRSLRENVERSLAPVFAWQVLRLVWKEIVANSESRQPTHLIVDEAWYLLEQPGAAQRLERMARSFRKYLAALYIATQDANKLVLSPEARAIAEIARIKLFFKQETESAVRAMGELFKLSLSEQADLLRVGKGEGLLLFGNELHLPLYVAVNPLRLGRLSTNSEQQQAVARASGRRSRPIV